MYSSLFHRARIGDDRPARIGDRQPRLDQARPFSAGAAGFAVRAGLAGDSAG
jgi:hypothetical protein